MNYTFCKTCENEFDLDEISDENICPHCGSEYDWLIETPDEIEYSDNLDNDTEMFEYFNDFDE